jgi:hypothetical protein
MQFIDIEYDPSGFILLEITSFSFAVGQYLG